jgi:hypothetical protein
VKLSVNLVVGGKYVRAGDELPSDFVLPPHLDRFVVYDQPPPQISRAGHRFSSGVEGHQEGFGTGARLAKSAAGYPEGEEEFAPKFVKFKRERKRRL